MAPWKMYSESFIIGKDKRYAAEKAELGVTRDRYRDNKSRRSFHMMTSAVEKSLNTVIQKILQFSEGFSHL